MAQIKENRMKFIYLFIMVVSMILMSSCEKSSNIDLSGIKETIDRQNRSYENAYNNKQIQKLGELHTVDAIVMPPNSKMVEGKEDIMRILNDEIQSGGQDIKFETLELVINGDFAYETGLYSVNMKNKGQEPVSDKGKYIVIWEKQSDGQWLMDKDIWNSDLPVNRN